MMDAEGFVRETDRVKDMIIRGVENHLPAKIEAVLVTNPQVAQVAVVGLQDEKWGENIAAFSLSDQPLNVTICAPTVEHTYPRKRHHPSGCVYRTSP